MTDGRPPRIARFLTAWTLLLLGLVLVEIRYLPPVLATLLVPYLALMAWYWIGGFRRRATSGTTEAREGGFRSPSDDGAGDEANFPEAAELSGTDSIPGPDSDPPSDGHSVPTSPRRGRSRRRPRTPEPGPSAASWVQVQPGRFLRVEEPSPPDQPDDSPPPDPEETQGVALTPWVPDAESAEPEIESPHESDQDSSGLEDQGAGSADPRDVPNIRADEAKGDPAGDQSRGGQALET